MVSHIYVSTDSDGQRLGTSLDLSRKSKFREIYIIIKACCYTDYKNK